MYSRTRLLVKCSASETLRSLAELFESKGKIKSITFLTTNKVNRKTRKLYIEYENAEDAATAKRSFNGVIFDDAEIPLEITTMNEEYSYLNDDFSLEISKDSDDININKENDLVQFSPEFNHSEYDSDILEIQNDSYCSQHGGNEEDMSCSGDENIAEESCINESMLENQTDISYSIDEQITEESCSNMLILENEDINNLVNTDTDNNFVPNSKETTLGLKTNNIDNGSLKVSGFIRCVSAEKLMYPIIETPLSKNESDQSPTENDQLFGNKNNLDCRVADESLNNALNNTKSIPDIDERHVAVGCELPVMTENNLESFETEAIAGFSCKQSQVTNDQNDTASEISHDNESNTLFHENMESNSIKISNNNINKIEISVKKDTKKELDPFIKKVIETILTNSYSNISSVNILHNLCSKACKSSHIKKEKIFLSDLINLINHNNYAQIKTNNPVASSTESIINIDGNAEESSAKVVEKKVNETQKQLKPYIFGVLKNVLVNPSEIFKSGQPSVGKKRMRRGGHSRFFACNLNNLIIKFTEKSNQQITNNKNLTKENDLLSVNKCNNGPSKSKINSNEPEIQETICEKLIDNNIELKKLENNLFHAMLKKREEENKGIFCILKNTKNFNALQILSEFGKFGPLDFIKCSKNIKNLIWIYIKYIHFEDAEKAIINCNKIYKARWADLKKLPSAFNDVNDTELIFHNICKKWVHIKHLSDHEMCCNFQQSYSHMPLAGFFY